MVIRLHPFADIAVPTMREFADKIGCLGLAQCSIAARCIYRLRDIAIPDILVRRGEVIADKLLPQYGQLPVPGRWIDVSEIVPINGNAAFAGLIQTGEQLNERALASAIFAHDGNMLTTANDERNITQHRRLHAWIAKRHPLHCDRITQRHLIDGGCMACNWQRHKPLVVCHSGEVFVNHIICIDHAVHPAHHSPYHLLHEHKLPNRLAVCHDLQHHPDKRHYLCCRLDNLSAQALPHKASLVAKHPQPIFVPQCCSLAKQMANHSIEAQLGNEGRPAKDVLDPRHAPPRRHLLTPVTSLQTRQPHLYHTTWHKRHEYKQPQPPAHHHHHPQACCQRH